MYKNKSDIPDGALFHEVVAMVQAKGDSRAICDLISRRIGHSYTRQMFDNFKNYRLGGTSALDGLKSLITKFVEVPGSHCLVIDDQFGEATGFVFQSGMQRAIFQRWGDCLLLDWTHNTNNVGFYLGTCCDHVQLFLY
jgi:hypothetical protein